MKSYIIYNRRNSNSNTNTNTIIQGNEFPTNFIDHKFIAVPLHTFRLTSGKFDTNGKTTIVLNLKQMFYFSTE